MPNPRESDRFSSHPPQSGGPRHGDLRDAISGKANRKPQGEAAPKPPPKLRLPERISQYEASLLCEMHAGANWFFWIAGLSFLNTVLTLAGSPVTFRLGLGLTLLVDSVARDPDPAFAGLTAAFRGFQMVIDPVCIGLTALWGVLGWEGYYWAIFAGGLLIVLDTLLLVVLAANGMGGVSFTIVLHLFALKAIFSAWSAGRALSGELARRGVR